MEEDSSSDPSGSESSQSPIAQFVEAISALDLFYWRTKKSAPRSTATLMIASGLLILLCRSIFFGVGEEGVAVLVELMSIMLLGLACAFALVRKGAKLPEDAYKLAHLLSAVWLLGLVLLVPSFFPTLRWFVNFESNWPLAAILGISATAIMLVRSLNLRRAKPKPAFAILTFLFVAAVTTIFLEVAVMDQDVHQALVNSTEFFGKKFNLGQGSNQ